MELKLDPYITVRAYTARDACIFVGRPDGTRVERAPDDEQDTVRGAPAAATVWRVYDAPKDGGA